MREIPTDDQPELARNIAVAVTVGAIDPERLRDAARYSVASHEPALDDRGTVVCPTCGVDYPCQDTKVYATLLGVADFWPELDALYDDRREDHP